MRRIMGTEVEYGISVPGDATANPVLTSTQVVLAYAAAADIPRARRARWDYEVESPLRDARGFDLGAPSMAPSDPEVEDLGAANVILTKGARLYVDHAHPEYSAPEVTNARDAVIWDKAGERVMQEAAERAATVPGQPRLQLYKNNVDGKGASYGTHENYLMARSTPFTAVIAGLTPFFASRQVVVGSGRVGVGPAGEEAGFQLSQRADYIEVEVGLETTLKRPIINTRDEPHADPEKYRRLHVIIGDANLAETSTYLKVGTAALVLSMIEDRFITADLSVSRPVASLKEVSHDPGLTHLLEVGDGRKMTAVQLQWEYFHLAERYLEERRGGDVDPPTKDVMKRWELVLTRLERDPFECADELDWVAKLKLLNSYRDRDGLAWSDAKLHLIDLQYADLRPEKGLYHRLVRLGRMKRLVSDSVVEEAMHEPPEDTRAYFRGRCLSKYADNIAAASWDSVIFDLPGHESLQRVPTIDPLRGSRAHVGALLDQHDTALGLFEALTAR